MNSDDEIDPHRANEHYGNNENDTQQALYGSINPFAEDDTQDSEPWSAGVPQDVAYEPREEECEDPDSHASDTHPYIPSGDVVGNQTPSEPVSQTPPPLLRFTVGQVVDRSNHTPSFTFDVTTNFPSYKARKYTGVERNQIELERLEAHLRATYPECLVPTLGPGTATSKYVPEYHNDRLVIMLLQQWMNRVTAHPILRQDYELRQFVETPFAFNPALATPPGGSAGAVSVAPLQSSSGFFSWGRPKQRVTRSANPTPFEQQLEQTSENMAVFQQNIAEARRWHGRLARTRARLAIDMKDVGTKLVSVGVIEHSPHLARSFKRLGKCFLHTGACAHTQSNLEGSRPIAVEDIYTLACDHVHKSLSCRQLIFTEHQVAERQLERKRQAVAVLRASTNISSEQTQDTLADFNVAKSDADCKRQRAERVDKVLAADLGAFEANREGDFRAMFGALARDQLQIERQVLGEIKAALESARNTGPVLSSINTSASASTISSAYPTATTQSPT
ncbi:Vacuolar protein sorting-associated protein 17 [Coemansia sp. RSA 1365]|nr:Vacuolar protein sorting-associated protein 17 [Coemansia sp. RSA 1365]